MSNDSASNWQRRWHPLLQEWVLISANTQKRPVNQGKATINTGELPTHDEHCYLCPGNKRASGDKNPDYQQIFVFNNDFPTLAEHAPTTQGGFPFEKTDHLKGECRVLCYDPHHNLALSDLSLEKIAHVFKAQQEEFRALSEKPLIENILIFENKGKETGASNPHPHGQIYATPFIPRNILQQLASFESYQEQHEHCLLCALIENEKTSERIILENEDFIVFVPFFARFAYESMLVPKQHHKNMLSFNDEELISLADIYRKIMQGYDKLFGFPFPNIISWINSPVNQKKEITFHCYLSFCPPLRSATQLKYLAGFESAGGNIVNPVQPEMAAKELKHAIRNSELP